MTMLRVFWKIMGAVLLAALLSGCWQKDVARSYHPSGKIRSEAAVKNSLLHGPAVMYYENGTKMSEASYKAGVLDGKSVAYYENGAKKAEADYKEGVLNGVWTPATGALVFLFLHHKSVSVSRHDSPQRAHKFAEEKALLRKLWRPTLDADPLYSPNLSLDRAFNLAFPPRHLHKN